MLISIFSEPWEAMPLTLWVITMLLAQWIKFKERYRSWWNSSFNSFIFQKMPQNNLGFQKS